MAGVVALLLCVAPSLAAQATTPTSPRDSGSSRLTLSVRNRTFRIPPRVVSGIAIQPTVRLAYAVTPRLQLAVDAQTVDNSGPGRQGSYLASRTVPGAGSGNFLQEVALEGAWRALGAAERGGALTVLTTVSLATRSYAAVDTATGATFGGNRRRAVPTVALQGRMRAARGTLHGALAAIFLPRDDALYLRRIPGERTAFGPLVGVELQGEHLVTRRTTAWGRGFLPLAGRNTIARTTGAPARAITYDAGLRWAISPALAVDGFVSNALGNTGALAYVADREYHAIGTGLRLRPGADDRAQSADRAHAGARPAASPLALAALAPAELEGGHASLRLRWGSHGLLAALEGAVVRQLQAGVFTDLLRGTRDEGELGAVARLTVTESARVRVGVVLAASRTNNPLVNLLAERSDELQRLGLPKGGFRFGDESLEEGRLYTFTGALPLQGHVGDRTLLRAAPVLGYVQRHGLQIGGIAVGAERDIGTSLRLVMESGVAAGRGNRLDALGRSHAIPWLLGVAWQQGREGSPRRTGMAAFDVFVTNRAGDSPFHMLRVRSHGDLSAGIGMRAAWP